MVKVVINEEFLDKLYVFDDRFDAGRKLASWLLSLGVVIDRIFAVPAGGLPVGFEMAKIMNAKLDIVIVRKILIPWNREAGFGAVLLDRTYFVDEKLVSYLGLSEEEVRQAIEEQIREIEHRFQRYRCGEDYDEAMDQIVAVVDDGIAAGYTMTAAIRFIRKLMPKKLIVAVPTCHTESLHRLVHEDVDEIYCYNPRTGPIYAVADAYKRWRDLNEEDVIEILRQAKSLSILNFRANCV